ncbi:MAG: DUF6504 family protein [Armatimonadota bacterium]
MARRIDEPIRVRYAGNGRVPAHFFWRRRKYEVEEIAAEWRRRGEWWRGGGERTYLRVIAHNGAAYDLCHDEATQCWTLDVLHD